MSSARLSARFAAFVMCWGGAAGVGAVLALSSEVTDDRDFAFGAARPLIPWSARTLTNPDSSVFGYMI